MVQYRIKRFFSGVHACVNGTDALTNWIKFVNASAPFTHAQTPEKNRLILIIFQCESFPYFKLLNWFQSCFLLDTIIVLSLQPPYYLNWLHKAGSSGMQKFIELWTDQKQTGDSTLVQSKGTKTIYINSIIWCKKRKHFFVENPRFDIFIPLLDESRGYIGILMSVRPSVTLLVSG